MTKFKIFILLNFISRLVMGQIDAKQFSDLWSGFIKNNVTNNSDWQKWYNDNTLWTIKTIGKKESDSKNSPFGDYFLDLKNFRYRKEDGLSDLSFSENDYFKNILSLHENESERKLVIQDSKYYPPCFEIIVEHENNIYYCYEEMVKLTYERARLKVLITYNESVDSKSDYQFVYQILIDNFSSIIKQANIKYPENQETEYLLIIGQKEKENLIWYSYIFNTRGIQKTN